MSILTKEKKAEIKNEISVFPIGKWESAINRKLNMTITLTEQAVIEEIEKDIDGYQKLVNGVFTHLKSKLKQKQESKK